MALGTHNFRQDPRNAEILISVNGTLYPRDKAMVSVFDSGFILGDGVWEGLRMHDGGVAFLEQHLERLYEGAKAIHMDADRVDRPAEAGPLQHDRGDRHDEEGEDAGGRDVPVAEPEAGAAQPQHDRVLDLDRLEAHDERETAREEQARERGDERLHLEVLHEDADHEPDGARRRGASPGS